MKYYKEKTGEELVLGQFRDSDKRADNWSSETQKLVPETATPALCERM